MIVWSPHLVCSQECERRIEDGADCFDDGCPRECCGCGLCCDPAGCPDTGQGYDWHP